MSVATLPPKPVTYPAATLAGGERPLSAERIARMTREELVGTIRSLPAPFLRPESYSRMEFWDSATLQRVLHLAHRCHTGSHH